MSEIDAARDILTDSFDRVSDQVTKVTTGLSQQDATWRPDPDANSIAWLVWHLSRVQDGHLADLARTEQVWIAGGWADRFALPFDHRAQGFGQDSDEVGRVQTPPAELAAYHPAVQDATKGYLQQLTAAELRRVVDDQWDPPVTATVRLVSVINDCTDHVGQAEYIRGMAERR